MSDNVLQTLQKLVQDVIAPDVRELKVRLESLAKETETRFDGVETRFDAMEKRMSSMESSLQHQMSSMEKSILAAIAESRAQSDLASLTAVATLRERVAVLESKAA